MGVNL